MEREEKYILSKVCPQIVLADLQGKTETTYMIIKNIDNKEDANEAVLRYFTDKGFKCSCSSTKKKGNVELKISWHNPSDKIIIEIETWRNMYAYSPETLERMYDSFVTKLKNFAQIEKSSKRELSVESFDSSGFNEIHQEQLIQRFAKEGINLTIKRCFNIFTEKYKFIFK